jgi:phage recombination protein Bet
MSTAAPSATPTSQPSSPTASPLVVMGERFQIAPVRLLETLRATVLLSDKSGRPASNEEVAAFCIVANQYQLNPFIREIYGFVSRGKVVPIVGVDGWVTLVNRHPSYDGVEFGWMEGPKGELVACTCRMWVRGRAHPVEVTEYYAECKRDTDQWRGMPRRMLRHKAYIQAARLAFGLSGIYDEDEGRDQVDVEPARPNLPPLGRTRLGPSPWRPEAAPVEEAPQPGPEMEAYQSDVAEQPPPAESIRDEEFNAICRDVSEAIQLATSIKELQDTAGKLMTDNQSRLGTGSAALLAAYPQQFKALQAAEKKGQKSEGK